jgi:hypothetical protein
VQADYGRLRETRVRDLVTLPSTPHSAALLPSKLCGYLNNKLNPLLLDTDLNGEVPVATNLFEAAAFAAMKLHCCTRAMHERPRWQLVAHAVDTAVEYCSDCAPRAATASVAARKAGGAFSLHRYEPLAYSCLFSRVSEQRYR